MTRRTFLYNSATSLVAVSFAGVPRFAVSDEEVQSVYIQTVLGPIPVSELGLPLPHEHILCDFIGAEKTGKHRYNSDEVVEVIQPYLQQVRELGVKSFFDCTPMFIGRDVEVLTRLSRATGLHIVTNTGLYKEPFLPMYAFEASADALAEIWIKEFEEGIDGTEVKPGFIKIAVNPGSLIPVQQKIVRAAARTHHATGLTIASHTAYGPAAIETIDLLEAEKVSPKDFIVVHTDSEPNHEYHLQIAKRGAWVEYDAVGRKPPEGHLTWIASLLDAGYENQLLLSMDAGWYSVGEERGGDVMDYTYLIKEFIPRMQEAGITEETIHQLTVTNPARAFGVERD
ncbi:phosphotriesterase [Candidatus Poribacteria bacterium]|nr:phosphotriesterase [Candidatus Poribacteria bacterium]